ncbi:beta-phosphoglucomutase [Fructilactobacillus sanfranciscensis]|uniref:beta-phosphoglucomutase n=1 Tax=Fructilactobacillus sanfranciscensis TaxID=1625 RepID=UPI001117B5FB|nr:beta-phosphoglucomutase [Fructilactobacillus sanfranciscensis]TNK97170.1 beta-phosphoglucomutase [Fructilactobacillus sanfranciscensis]
MKKFNDIKGFIFDLDGVISTTSNLHSKAWQEIANEVGTKWTKELANNLKGVSRMDSLNLILKSGNQNHNYTAKQKKYLTDKKNSIYLRLVNQLTPYDVLPGIKDFLESLIRNNYLIALASASKNSSEVLKRLKLTRFFPKIVDPSTLKHGKPSPDIYLEAVKLLKLNPEQCAGIEDANAGADAINAANEISIGIGNKDILKQADIVFSNTEKLTLDNIKKFTTII